MATLSREDLTVGMILRHVNPEGSGDILRIIDRATSPENWLYKIHYFTLKGGPYSSISRFQERALAEGAFEICTEEEWLEAVLEGRSSR